MSAIRLGDILNAAFGFTTVNQSKSLEKSKFVDKSGAAGSGVFVNDASFEEMTLRLGEKSFRFADMMQGDDGGKIYAPPPMVSYSKSKNLIITAIDGSDAEVVERYGDKSWEITIRGIIIDMVNHQYPKQKMIQIRQFFDEPSPYKVEGQMFDDLGIKSIYFKKVDVSGVQGYEDSIQFTLEANSIKPVEFFINAQNK